MTQVFCLSGLGRLQGGQKGKGIWLPPGIYTQGQLSSLRAPKQAGARRRGAAVENRRTWAPRRCGNRSRGCVCEPPPARTPQPRRLVTHGRDPRLQTRVTGTRVPKKKKCKTRGTPQRSGQRDPAGRGTATQRGRCNPGKGGDGGGRRPPGARRPEKPTRPGETGALKGEAGPRWGPPTASHPRQRRWRR